VLSIDATKCLKTSNPNPLLAHYNQKLRRWGISQEVEDWDIAKDLKLSCSPLSDQNLVHLCTPPNIPILLNRRTNCQSYSSNLFTTSTSPRSWLSSYTSNLAMRQLRHLTQRNPESPSHISHQASKKKAMRLSIIYRVKAYYVGWNVSHSTAPSHKHFQQANMPQVSTFWSAS
jgi:hypothetical protein